MKLSHSMPQPQPLPMPPSAPQPGPQPQLPMLPSSPTDSVHFQGIGGSKPKLDPINDEKKPLLKSESPSKDEPSAEKPQQPKDSPDKAKPAKPSWDADPAARHFLLTYGL